MIDLLPEGTTLELKKDDIKFHSIGIFGQELTKEDFEVAIKSISNCTYALNFALYTSALRKFSAIYEEMKAREKK